MHLDISDLFLKNKYVDVNSKDDDGWTSLHVAAFNGNLDAIILLLQSGAQINSLDNDDWTPLHCAARKGYLKVVELLLQEGAQTDAKTKHNETPLMWLQEN